MNIWIKIYLAVSSILLMLLCYKTFFADTEKKELVLHKLTIADRNSGKPVVVIADTVPEPVLNGEELKGRIFKPRGIIYYDAEGNETGGIVVNTEKGRERSLITMDYSNTDAFSIFKDETDSTYVMGLSISDKNSPEEFKQRGSAGIPRIALQNRDKTAAFAMFDKHGRERILFLVDDKDEVKMLILDREGKPVKDLLQ